MRPPATRHSVAPELATIGYEGATIDGVLRALQAARVKLLLDVRAVRAVAQTRLLQAAARGGAGPGGDRLCPSARPGDTEAGA